MDSRSNIIASATGTSEYDGRTFNKIQKSTCWVTWKSQEKVVIISRFNIFFFYFSVVELEYVDNRALQNRVPYSN